MKKDIQNREDIALLVDQFYEQVRKHERLGYIFDVVAAVDWEEHLPKLYDFWASMLLGEMSFKGNPMQKHMALSKLTAMTEQEFSEWLRLFVHTVDTHFSGEKAEEAKIRAGNIARLMLHNIQSKMK